MCFLDRVVWDDLLGHFIWFCHPVSQKHDLSIEPLHGLGLTAMEYKTISHDACPILGIRGLIAGVDSPDMASARTGKPDTSWSQQLRA